MNDLIRFLEEHFLQIWFVFLAITLFNIVSLWYKRKKRDSIFPNISQGQIIYKENFASGRSYKSLKTKLGNAQNCLSITVTRNELWIAPFFPFSLFAQMYDLEHRIKKEWIREVKETKAFGKRGFIITHLDDKGKKHTFELWPWHSNKFSEALGIPVNR